MEQNKELLMLMLKNSIQRTDKKMLKEFFCPSFCRMVIIIFCLILYSLFHIYILRSNANIKEFWINFLGDIQTIELYIMSFLIGGYAIFQAFSDEEILIKLLKNDLKGNIYFIKINKYFYCITLSYFVMILINLCLINILKSTSFREIIVICPYLKNKIIQLFILNLYLFVNMVLIFDIKSFLKNIHDIFVINTTNYINKR